MNRSHNFKTFASTVVMAFALCVTGTANAQQAPAKVRFGVDQFILGAQVWVAKDKGFFEKNGVDADVLPFSLGVDTLDAVLTERIDFGLGLDFAAMTRLQSGQLKVVSAIIEPLPGFHKLAVRKPIAKPQDLSGKRMGLAKGSAQHLVTVKYLENNGVANASLVPFSSLLEIVAALRADRIDAAFVWGDGTNQAASIPDVSIIGDDSAANMRQFGYLITRNRFADSQPKAVEATLRALAEATDWMGKNMDEAAQIVATRSKAPLENVKRQMPTQNYTISLKSEQLVSFKVIASFAADNGITKSLIDPASSIEPSFLRRVDPGRVTMNP